MSATERYKAIANEDGSFTLIGLITARDGTGATAPNASDGKLIAQADLSAIVLNVFDIDSTTPNTATLTSALTISSVIQSALQTTGIWTNLEDGGNFLYDVAATVLATGNHVYDFEVKFTTTGGAVSWGRWQITANAVRTS